MVTPDALDQIFAAYLAAHERRAPTDTELAALIASFAFPTQRRAARHYVRGFLRGCDYCDALGRQQTVRDLDSLARHLRVVVAFVQDLRAAAAPPESTG